VAGFTFSDPLLVGYKTEADAEVTKPAQDLDCRCVNICERHRFSAVIPV